MDLVFRKICPFVVKCFSFFSVSLLMLYRFGEEMRPVKLTTKVFGTCRTQNLLSCLSFLV